MADFSGWAQATNDLIFGIWNAVAARKKETRDYRRFLENRQFETSMNQFYDRLNYNRFLENREYESATNQMQRLKEAGLSEHAAANVLGAGSASVPVSSPPDSGQPPTAAPPPHIDLRGSITGAMTQMLTSQQIKEQIENQKLQNEILRANKENLIKMKDLSVQRLANDITEKQYRFEQQKTLDSMLIPDKDGNMIPGFMLSKANAMEDLKSKQYENEYKDKIAEMRVKRYQIDKDMAQNKLDKLIEERPIDLAIKRNIRDKIKEEFIKLQYYNSEIAPILKQIADENLTKAKAQNWLSNLTDPTTGGAISSVVEGIVSILKAIIKFL